MKQINEDLGQTFEEQYGGPESPDKMRDKKQYPSFTYSDDDEPLDIPKRGKMLVEYEETRREESTRDGKKHYECRIEVRTIISVEAAKADKKETKAADALDAIKEALESEAQDDEGDEDND